MAAEPDAALVQKVTDAGVPPANVASVARLMQAVKPDDSFGDPLTMLRFSNARQHDLQESIKMWVGRAPPSSPAFVLQPLSVPLGQPLALAWSWASGWMQPERERGGASRERERAAVEQRQDSGETNRAWALAPSEPPPLSHRDCRGRADVAPPASPMLQVQ